MTATTELPGRCGGQCRQPPDFAFTMAFQPVVDLAARRIYAYEALVRGPAGEPAATILGQVTADNRYAFDQACRGQGDRRRRRARPRPPAQHQLPA